MKGMFLSALIALSLVPTACAQYVDGGAFTPHYDRSAPRGPGKCVNPQTRSWHRPRYDGVCDVFGSFFDPTSAGWCFRKDDSRYRPDQYNRCLND